MTTTCHTCHFHDTAHLTGRRKRSLSTRKEAAEAYCYWHVMIVTPTQVKRQQVKVCHQATACHPRETAQLISHRKRPIATRKKKT